MYRAAPPDRDSDLHVPVADGSGHDRQTLVVDGGPAALATAGFLDQAGLDPVLADVPGVSSDPAVVALWQPGLDLLERIGLRRPVETLGTALTDLRCAEPSCSWTGNASGRPSLVALRRESLEAVMRQHLTDRFRTADRPVASVEPTGRGVRATFEGGIEEQFDAVATSRPLLWPGDAAEPETSVHWWSFEWPASVPAPEVATEAWGPDCGAFQTPVGESVRVDLVATDGAATARPLSLGALRTQFGHLSTPLEETLATLDGSSLRYRRVADAVPGTLCVDGVASVGPAAHASVPGGCLGPALAVEDGWVLADALAYGPAALEDALAAYADRRRQRLTAISSALRDDALLARVSDDLSGPLARLCARRTVAFGHLFDETAEELVDDVPERL